MATPVLGARPVWWPNQDDLGAMVGLARCGDPARPERSSAVARSELDDDEHRDEHRDEPSSAALAARLCGLLRSGC